MAHWAEFLSRGILFLLSFSNLGTGIRCFIAQEFVISKLFQNQSKDYTFSHMFGIYSILMSLIFSQSAIFLYVYPLTRLVYGCIISYLSLFLLEIYHFKSIDLTSSVCFPLAINAIILIWIFVFHMIWKPFRLDGMNDPEKEAIIKHGLPNVLKAISERKKKKLN